MFYMKNFMDFNQTYFEKKDIFEGFDALQSDNNYQTLDNLEGRNY